MKTWAVRIGAVVAVALLILTIVNAQWLADEPKGSVKLVADRGVGPLAVAGAGDTCAKARVEAPYTDYMPGTVPAIVRSLELGAGIALVDVNLTADGQIVLMDGGDLACISDASGPVTASTLEQLRAADIGNRYTADGGQTFPLRGQGVGQIGTVAELIQALPRRARLMYNLPAGNPDVASALLAQLNDLGRDPVKVRDAFTGDSAAIDLVRARLPEAWAWTAQEAHDCSNDYIITGWSGYLPPTCRGGTMIIPAGNQLPYWGWPNRLIARMEAYGGHIIMTGSGGSGDPLPGITLPENLGEVPASFNGYLMVADIFAIAPALHTRLDNRTQSEIDATTLAMQKRRTAN